MMVSGLDNKLSDANGKPNSTLLYGNGPEYSGQAQCRQRPYLCLQCVLSSLLFSETTDQTYIPHAIGYHCQLGAISQVLHYRRQNVCTIILTSSFSIVMVHDNCFMNQSYTRIITQSISQGISLV
jgi:hypothetical protein